MDYPKILVVDDDDDVVSLVQLEFAKAGIRTDTAASAAEAQGKMERCVYPVVVLDIHMPGMSGVDLLDALKRRNSLVQVIMLTADATLAQVIACMDRGATDFFSKTSALVGVVEAATAALGRAARWLSWLGSPNRVPTGVCGN